MLRVLRERRGPLRIAATAGVACALGWSLWRVRREVSDLEAERARLAAHAVRAPAGMEGLVPVFAGDGQVTLARPHAATAWGQPVADRVLFEPSFVVGYDNRTRQARWVLERRPAAVGDDAEAGTPVVDRKAANAQFYEEEAVEELFRARLDDYRGSGFDRGHMAPCGNHKHDLLAFRRTFTLANSELLVRCAELSRQGADARARPFLMRSVSPQVGKGFNRDYWARLEAFTRSLENHFDEVIIATGPLWVPHRVEPSDREVERAARARPRGSPEGGNRWEPKPKWEVRHRVIGDPPNVAVPTHYYKAVLGVKRGADDSSPPQLAVAAWVLPNARIDPDTPLAQFETPLAVVESLSGLRLFDRAWALAPVGQPPVSAKEVAKLPQRGAPRALCDAAQCALPPPDWWKKGRARAQAAKRAAAESGGTGGGKA